jgi:hypothetical protein
VLEPVLGTAGPLRTHLDELQGVTSFLEADRFDREATR